MTRTSRPEGRPAAVLASTPDATPTAKPSDGRTTEIPASWKSRRKLGELTGICPKCKWLYPDMLTVEIGESWLCHRCGAQATDEANAYDHWGHKPTAGTIYERALNAAWAGEHIPAETLAIAIGRYVLEERKGHELAMVLVLSEAFRRNFCELQQRTELARGDLFDVVRWLTLALAAAGYSIIDVTEETE